ncbi:hypothetical protein [Pseudomarimonas arenosa]|uniref:hypothetical protein n=1 Tax=Pseudomarimonas arenosa TaxID=2774145 RepID=UPI001CDD0B33|nr:hypothetical protein [Pseudomarimonas arenosa]
MTGQGDTSAPIRERSVSVVALLLSLSTLLCCALPLLLVALGFGSAVAALTSSAPWLVTLSQYKVWTFGVAAGVLGLAGYMLYRRGRSCPTEPLLADACQRAQRWSRRIWWCAVLVWCIAAVVAFAWIPLQRLLA